MSQSDTFDFDTRTLRDVIAVATDAMATVAAALAPYRSMDPLATHPTLALATLVALADLPGHEAVGVLLRLENEHAANVRQVLAGQTFGFTALETSTGESAYRAGMSETTPCGPLQIMRSLLHPAEGCHPRKRTIRRGSRPRLPL